MNLTAGLKLTLRSCTTRKKAKEAEKLPQVNFFSHSNSNFQFFAIVLSYIVQRTFWGGSIMSLKINLVFN